ncbi:MAG: branched-chain amino acid ABC transporter permease [Rhodobacteraceae bacterium]|nr:branched-chain amino acid ABC transporter permease [Paracoccaceae bacterium]
MRTLGLFALVAALIIATGVLQSWNSALIILNMGLVSAIMALGVNLQWGLAGLFNVGVMGFVALGGLAVVLTSVAPVPEAWAAGGWRIIAALALGLVAIVLSVVAWKRLPRGRRGLAVAVIAVGGFFLYRAVLEPGVDAVEAVNPAATGFLGGLGLPVLLAWPVGGLLAAGVAWVIGKTALGLRSDYLAIATLGIAEIIIAVMKNEDWLARGVKNVIGLPRPVPYEVDLQASPSFVETAGSLGLDATTASTLYVKLGYSVLFTVVLVVLLVLAQLALNSPWGRMMRAIRDNEEAAEAMGKDVTARHLQIFILGSALCGIAGAMMTTLDGQLTPSSYQPLRYTFLVWVMVIVGGSGNNLGAVLGGFLIWFLWVQVEPIGQWVMGILTSGMADGSAIKAHLLDSVQHMRLLTMGVILLLVLRFAPRGLLPER